MKQYTNFCTYEQTKRALKLGAPIEHKPLKDFDYEEQYYYCKGNGKYYVIPTTHQMFGWLREKGILITFIGMPCNNCKYSWYFLGEYSGYTNTYESAESDSIDAAFDYLEKKGEKQ